MAPKSIVLDQDKTFTGHFHTRKDLANHLKLMGNWSGQLELGDLVLLYVPNA